MSVELWPVITQWVPVLWLEFLWANDLTTEILSLRVASFRKLPPRRKSPFVITEPLTDLTPSGAEGLGSKVSICVAPPPSQSHTTDFSLVGRDCACASDSPRADRPALMPPTCIKLLLLN